MCEGIEMFVTAMLSSLVSTPGHKQDCYMADRKNLKKKKCVHEGKILTAVGAKLPDTVTMQSSKSIHKQTIWKYLKYHNIGFGYEIIQLVPVHIEILWLFFEGS